MSYATSAKELEQATAKTHFLILELEKMKSSILFFFFWKFFFTLSTKLSHITTSLPLNIDSDCLINIVSAFSRQHQLGIPKTIRTHLHSYTFFHANSFNLRIPTDILSNDNFTLKQGYFRFTNTQKSSSQCLIFVLLTTNFAETALAIQNSGFSTSEEVIFCINFNLKYGAREILYMFSNLVYMSKLQPFRASLLFYTDKSKDVSIYCYFCPNRQTFHNFPRNRHLFEILKVHEKLNGQGYGKFVVFKLPFHFPGMLMIDDVSFCLKMFTGRNKNLKALNKALDKCLTPEVLQYSLTQDVLNVTLSFHLVDFPDSEVDTENWFMHKVIVESVIGDVPLEIVHLRNNLLGRIRYFLASSSLHRYSRCIRF